MLEDPGNCQATFDNISLNENSEDTVEKVIEKVGDSDYVHYPISDTQSKSFYGHRHI
jgi:hypothetical protein